ncbi:hypothetical protein DFH08DRAFT_812997 [Mycena albidolilacea]|uniref:Uncharacterized protein n=1 Tax=Mycena albidolilacea TaxID=1033008 RepID=A0AAD6ZUA5_9AGAR|nr:hypothetical protein DFH08DRAFT_812997 [Mycena albidolilacea]
MAQITRDPELDLCPSFVGPIFQDARNTIVTTVPTKTSANAVDDLTVLWQADWDAKKAAWDAQETANQATRDEATRKQAEIDAELAAEKKEADRKKPKVNDFDSNRGIAESIALQPSLFTLCKLERFKYVEAWYFTREGCCCSKSVVKDVNLNWDQLASAKNNILHYAAQFKWLE